ncbi:MAG: MBL fold metallo-hydrolase [Woeseiaceae bacterium]
MAIDYIKSDTATLYKSQSGSEKLTELLWGDSVQVLTTSGSRRKVKARGRTGYVKSGDLGGESLLEVYFIDVGQGDGVLIRTPNNKHIMIDGGYKRSKQPTGKNAADFVDWKFAKDYGKTKIKLDAMIASHCDADHYGGLWDLLNPNETSQLDLPNVEVDNFYHAGVGWWKKPGGGRYLGPVSDGYLTQILGNRASVGAGLAPGGPGLKLQGEWADFLQVVHDHGCPITRLTHASAYVPGFEPASGKASIKVLAPVEYSYDSGPAFRSLGSADGQNTNGHSVLLRLDYGRSRILLTGDLNKASQQLLLDEYVGERTEFLCDVAKGCHHGSDDVSYEFLQAMAAAATVISSGDNEGHAHPRPNIVSASAITGHVHIKNDELLTPLVYSTEISRSINVGKVTKLTHTNIPGPNGPPLEVTDFGNTRVDYEVVKVGDLNPSKVSRTMKNRLIVDGIVYGLVNVRTNGSKILCAVLNEKKSKWEYQAFDSRF